MSKPDFHYSDYDPIDFNTGLNVKPITDWFFSRFAPWYKSADTYKDSEGRGLLQRYLGAFDPEVLENFYPRIDNFLDIIDAQICDPKYLSHISDSLGKPPDIFGTIDGYRNLLSYIVSIYKIKGTKLSYELFFNILGFTTEIYEVPLTTQNSNYDKDGDYDSENFGSFYDQNICQPCSFYDLILYPKESLFFNISQELINNIKETISFNEPINAKLRYLIIGLNFTDSLSGNITELEVETTILPGSVYDGELLYDDDNEYEPN